MSMRNLALIALLLLLPAALWAADDDPAAGLADNLKTLLDVYTILDQQAADPVSPDQAFYQGAIPGMLRTLDPHSIFFDPDHYALYDLALGRGAFDETFFQKRREIGAGWIETVSARLCHSSS